MALNPLHILKIKSILNDFRTRHPGFARFIKAIRKKGLPQGSVLEVKITFPEGQTMETNIRVSEEDLELLRTLSDLANS